MASARPLWAWSHLDNFLFAHNDPYLLEQLLDIFLAQLTACGIRLNPSDSQFCASPTVEFLELFLDGHKETMGHTPMRHRDLLLVLQTLRFLQTKNVYQRGAGLLSFYFSVYAAHYHAIRPLHVAAFSGLPPPLPWLGLFEQMVAALSNQVPFDFVPVLQDVFADASTTGLGICLPQGNVAVLSTTPTAIYNREL